MRLAAALVLLAGCVDAPPDEPPPSQDWPAWANADLVEAEPNDVVPQELGPLTPNVSLAGTWTTCSRDGGWEGADVDLFSLAFADDALVRLRLRAEGADLDLDLYDPDGDLLAELSSSGPQDETVDVALSAGDRYLVRIRCWLGDDDRWVLAIADRS